MRRPLGPAPRRWSTAHRPRTAAAERSRCGEVPSIRIPHGSGRGGLRRTPPGGRPGGMSSPSPRSSVAALGGDSGQSCGIDRNGRHGPIGLIVAPTRARPRAPDKQGLPASTAARLVGEGSVFGRRTRGRSSGVVDTADTRPYLRRIGGVDDEPERRADRGAVGKPGRSTGAGGLIRCHTSDRLLCRAGGSTRRTVAPTVAPTADFTTR
jgi:hypothetical protein